MREEGVRIYGTPEISNNFPITSVKLPFPSDLQHVLLDVLS